MVNLHIQKDKPKVIMLLTWSIWDIKLCTAVVEGPKIFHSVRYLTQNTVKKLETT